MHLQNFISSRKQTVIVALLSAIAFPSFSAAENKINNPGFESGKSGWTTFIPPESKALGVEFSVQDEDAQAGNSAARLSAEESARFAIAPESGFSVAAGERYRVEAWYKAEPEADVSPGTPGIVLRATFSDAAGEDVPAGHLYIGPGGDVADGPTRALGVRELAEEWTQIEAVIEVPQEAERLRLNIFLWRLAGAVLIDNVSVEAVPKDTPVTPLLGAARRSGSSLVGGVASATSQR